nr:phospholipase-like protein [Tanacetum cinerariifolium]
MATLYVRRSGHLSNQKKQNQVDDKEEVIDLTTEDWDGAGDEFMNDEPKDIANGMHDQRATTLQIVGVS